MKKRLVSLFAIIFSVVLGITTLAGCKLVTIDNDKDLAQTIAVVKTFDDVPDSIATITKKDLLYSYLNNGQSVIQSFETIAQQNSTSYSQKDVVDYLFENLISSKIILQKAMKLFADKDSKACTYNVEDYLTEEEKTKALSDVYKTLRDLLDYYVNEDEAVLVSDKIAETVRTIPTGAVNFVEEDETTYTSIDTSTIELKNAYDRFIKLIDNYGLLGNDYKGKIEETVYFEDLLTNNYQATLLNNYEIEYRLENFGFEKLEKAYEDALLKQQDFSSQEFATALSNATKDSPVFYGAYGNYGYVYNLLLGVNDYQKAEISKIDSKLSDEEKLEQRIAILNATTVTDLRSTWILSGYDFDGEKFTGDYAFSKDNSLPFQGTVTLVKEADTEKKTSAEYRVDSLKTFTLDEFIDFMETYVYGAPLNGEENTDVEIYKKVLTSGAEDYDAKINELLFAFSTDPGSLNKDKGYVISPNNTEGFVESFSKAGQELLTMGGNSYIMVASDYGYHIMFFSESFNVGGIDNLVDYLNSFGETKTKAQWTEAFNDLLKNWDDVEDTDDILYRLTNGFLASKFTNEFNKFTQNEVNLVRDNDQKVKTYEDRFSDMLGK